MQLSRTALRPLGAGVVAALVTAVLVTVAPAAFAAPTLTLTASSPEIEAGGTATIEWAASDDADTVIASGNGWATAGPKDLTGSEEFQATEPGTFTFTLTATDADDADNPTEQTVTVTVVEPSGDTEVTPEPVTQEGCSFTIPDVAGVGYLVEFDGELEPLEPGTYPTFIFEEETIAITAEAQEGFTLAEGATTDFTVEVGEECQLGAAELVTATPTCQAVTFTNVTDQPVAIEYGSFDAEDSDGGLTLDPGQSEKISTERAELGFFALDPSFLDELEESEDFAELPEFQFDTVSVPQNCSTESGAGAEFPTTAPAAGI